MQQHHHHLWSQSRSQVAGSRIGARRLSHLDPRRLLEDPFEERSNFERTDAARVADEQEKKQMKKSERKEGKNTRTILDLVVVVTDGRKNNEKTTTIFFTKNHSVALRWSLSSLPGRSTFLLSSRPELYQASN